MFGLVFTFGLIALVFWRSLRTPGVLLALVLGRLGLDQIARASSGLFVDRSWAVDLVVGVVTLCGFGWAVVSGHFKARGLLRPALLGTAAFFLFYIWSSQWGFSAPVYRTLVTKGFATTFALNVCLAPLLISSVRDFSEGARNARLVCALLSVYVLANPSLWTADARRLELIIVGSPEEASNALALADVGGIAFMFAVLSPHFTRWHGLRSVAVYASAIVGLLVTASASRGETGAAVVASLAVLTLTGLERLATGRRTIGTLAVLVLGSAATALIGDMGMGSRYTPDMLRSGLAIRVSLTEQVLDRFLTSPEHWPLGLGAGTSHRLIGSYPHNQLVQALVESGVVGALFWLSVPLAATLALWQAWPYVREAPHTRFAFSAVSALLLYSVILTFKRGTVLDTSVFMVALIAERLAVVLRHEARGRPPVPLDTESARAGAT